MPGGSIRSAPPALFALRIHDARDGDLDQLSLSRRSVFLWEQGSLVDVGPSIAAAIHGKGRVVIREPHLRQKAGMAAVATTR